jgi:hypothetical protein
MLQNPILLIGRERYEIFSREALLAVAVQRRKSQAVARRRDIR